MVYGFYNLFPADGKMEPPKKEEISAEIKNILALYRRGFCDDDELVEVLTDMVRRAESFAFFMGIETLKKK